MKSRTFISFLPEASIESLPSLTNTFVHDFLDRCSHANSPLPLIVYAAAFASPEERTGMARNH